MGAIRDILERRSARQFYEDCSTGRQILRSGELHAYETGLFLERINDDHILFEHLAKLMGQKELGELLLQNHIRYLPLSAGQREVIKDLVKDATAREAVRSAAEQEGCAQFACCLLCPRGWELVEGEIFLSLVPGHDGHG